MMSALWNRASFKSLIARRLIVAFVLFSSLITVVTTAIQLYVDYRQGLIAIEEDFTLIEASYLESLTSSIWSFDSAQIDLQLAGIMNLPDMEYVEVLADGDNHWSAGRRISDDIVSTEFPVRFTHRGEELTIGTLEAVASLSSLYQRLWNKALVIFVGNGIKTFLVVGFVFLIFHRLVTRRVEWLSGAVAGLGQGSSMPVGGTLPRNGSSLDELDQLETAIREMRESQLGYQRSFREREAQFTAILENSPLLVSLKDVEGRYLLVNRGWEQAFGRKDEDVRGKRPEDVLPEELVASTQSQEQGTLETGRSSNIEQTFRSSGLEVTLETISFPVLRSNGTQIGICAIGADITERMRVEREIMHLNETLERRVEERTAELHAAQEALLRQERLAALGQLTGTVAHEIRNPLGALASSVHVIKHKCAEAGLDLEVALDRTDRSIRRCDRIITDLLDYARARGIQREPVALDAWLSALLKEQDIAEGVTVKTNLGTGGAKALFDPEAIRRAVINLIDNACQAILEGTDGTGAAPAATLTVTSRRNGAWVEIELSDAGPGIPEDVLPHVLEPLFSTKSFGTGLGLPTVQRIMAEHDGELEITSEEGRGTRALLRLPSNGQSEETQKT